MGLADETVGRGNGSGASDSAGVGTSASQDHPVVLVTDDDPDTRQIVSKVLEDEYRVLEAADGGEAPRIMGECARLGSAEGRVRVVLVDIMMPGMDGHTLCRRIKEEYDAAVVMLTARAYPSDIRIAIQNGADDYLVKPFDRQKLLEKVSSRLVAPGRAAPQQNRPEVLVLVTMRMCGASCRSC